MQPKLNVYGIQIAAEQLLTLPVSIGTLWSYLSTKPDIFEHLSLLGMSISFEDSVLEIIDQIESKGRPDIILLSLYMWNRNRSNKLTRALKEKWPHLIIIAGGNDVPEIPERLQALAQSQPQYDYFVSGEGELPLENILRKELKRLGRLDTPYDPTLFSCYEDGEFRMSIKRVYMNKLDEMNIPSPSAMGIYDELALKYRDRELGGVLETNRGCPYSCTFCDWGVREKVRLFPLHRVQQEITWMVDHVKELMISDGNFGIMERDFDIALFMIDQIKNRPQSITHTANIMYSKTHKQNVLKIAEVLEKNDLTQAGASFSLQSLHEPTLKAIKRNNLGVYRNMDWIIENFNKRGIRFYSDMIIGLPLETRTSFLQGLETLLAANPFEVHIYKLAILENSEIRKANDIEKYRMEFTDWVAGPSPHEDEREFTGLIRSTSTMNREDVEYVCRIRDYIQVFWFGKLTYFIQNYLRDVHKIPITLFYEDFHDHVLRTKDPFWQAILKFMRDEKNYNFPYDKNHPFHRMTNTWLYIAGNAENKSLFYSKLKRFCLDRFPHLDKEEIEDLFYFNERMVTDHEVASTREFQTQFNWAHYFLRKELLLEETRYQAQFYKLGTGEYSINRPRHEVLYYMAGGHPYTFNKQNSFLYQSISAVSSSAAIRIINKNGLFLDHPESITQTLLRPEKTLTAFASPSP